MAGHARRPGTANPLADRATEAKAVTDDVLGSIDLGKEIGVNGRDLRLRRLVVQPGGVVPFHSHAGRPALIITISGEITEHRSSCAVPITHRAGELSREADGVSHYWINHGNEPAVLLSADVKAADNSLPAGPTPRRHPVASRPCPRTGRHSSLGRIPA